MSRERREGMLRVRMSAEELAAIDERVPVGETRAAWVRRVVLGQRRKRPLPAVDPALLREALRWGSNLNQAVRAMHVARLRGQVGPAATERLARSIDECREALSALLRAYRQVDEP